MIQGFLFDLDGTLVETHRANFEAYKQALADHGFHITWEQFKPSIGKQAKVFLPELAPGLTSEEYLRIGDSKAKYYREMMHLTRANEPLITFMRSISRHYPLGLVTTARPENAMAILKHHDLTDVFTVIITDADIKKSKPDPEGYLMALKHLKLSPREVIAFEDSETGRTAAEAAGLSVILVKDFLV